GCDGGSLRILRDHQRPIQQGRGPVHGADVRRLPGRPRPRQRPYPVMTGAQMRAGLDLLPTWASEQKAPPTATSSRSCANGWRGGGGRKRAQPPRHRGHAPTAGGGRGGGPDVQEPGLAWLERQAEIAEDLV